MKYLLFDIGMGDAMVYTRTSTKSSWFLLEVLIGMYSQII